MNTGREKGCKEIWIRTALEIPHLPPQDTGFCGQLGKSWSK